jgi:hypothetical protein
MVSIKSGIQMEFYGFIPLIRMENYKENIKNGGVIKDLCFFSYIMKAHVNGVKVRGIELDIA